MGRLSGFVIYGGVLVFTFFITTHLATQGTFMARPWEPPDREDLLVGIGSVIAFIALSHLWVRIKKKP